MENNYVYASVQVKEVGSVNRFRRYPLRSSESPTESSSPKLKLTFSYNVHHRVVHQPEDAELPSTVLSRSSAAAVNCTAWWGTTAAFNNRPQILYRKIAAIFTNLGIDKKSHRRLFDNLVAGVRRAAATVSPKLMILPLTVSIVRDHLIFISDEEDEKVKKEVDAAAEKEKVQKSRRRRRRRRKYW